MIREQEGNSTHTNRHFPCASSLTSGTGALLTGGGKELVDSPGKSVELVAVDRKIRSRCTRVAATFSCVLVFRSEPRKLRPHRQRREQGRPTTMGIRSMMRRSGKQSTVSCSSTTHVVRMQEKTLFESPKKPFETYVRPKNPI